MLELLLMRADGASSCSKDHVADGVRSESKHGQQSNDASVNKKNISVSIENPISLCCISKGMQILDKREAKESKIEAGTIRKNLPAEAREVLCGIFEDKEVVERMQRFRSLKCAIEYVLSGINGFSENIHKRLENQKLRDEKRKALDESYLFEGYSYKAHGASILADFAYVLKRFADSDKNIKEACKVFDSITECGLPLYYGNALYAVKRSENGDKNFKEPVFAFKRIIESGESIDNDDDLDRISGLLNKALENCKKKDIARDSIQTSDSKMLEFVLSSLKQDLAAGHGTSDVKARNLVDAIEKQQNAKNETEFFYLKSFDDVIQYISDYIESILVAERSLTRDEFRYIFGIIDQLKDDYRIKFFKEKSLLFEHFSKYAAKSDEPSEEYLHSEYVRYNTAKFVDEMLICCQKHFYSSFLTKIFPFPEQCHFSNWSDGIWDFRKNGFKRLLKRPLEGQLKITKEYFLLEPTKVNIK